jgi:hypothetical protein
LCRRLDLLHLNVRKLGTISNTVAAATKLEGVIKRKIMSCLGQHAENHLVDRIGWMRAAVLGANDGIVSTASLIVGVAAAAANQNAVLIAGIAGLVAGAMAMAAGEYVSVSSQSDTERADLALERKELRDNPAFELEELAQIYVKRGVAGRPSTPSLCHNQTHAPQQKGSLFDHLVGASKQRQRNCDTERLGGLEVDHEFVLGGRLHRQVCWPFAFEDAVHICCCLPVLDDKIRPIGDQTAAVVEIAIENRDYVQNCDIFTLVPSAAIEDNCYDNQ